MTWVRVDDGFFEHPKTIAAGDDAAYLFLAGLGYCNRRLTDGTIPKSMVGRLTTRRRWEPLAARLVAVGYWHDRGDAYESHDYLSWNPSRAQVESRREAERKRKHRGAESARNPDGRAADEEADSVGPLHSTPLRPSPSGGLLSPPDPPRGAAAAPPARRGAGPPAKGAAVWSAYAEAYRDRYGTDPVRNAKVNAHTCQLVDRLGVEDAPPVAAWYVGHPHARYVAAGHALWALVQDAEKLRTEWRTGHVVTQTQARQADQTGTNAETLRALLAERDARKDDHP